MTIDALVTVHPYAPYIEEILKHPVVSGIRLNTVMEIKNPDEKLKQLDELSKKYGKELWIDLKCRQLRTKNYCNPPYGTIELSHKINVRTPLTAYFQNGKEHATVLEVDENKLIMQQGPKRLIGPGESVNIPDESLIIEGYFTEKDKEYIEAGNRAGIKNFMLSFVEKKSDIEEMYNHCSNANLILKIESKRGMKFVENEYSGKEKLMAARGDLFIELKMPHNIIEALEKILVKDKNAIVGSRIFDSVWRNLEPSCEDIGDVDNLLRMGYKTLMFGDEICLERDAIISGLNLFEIMAEKYQSKLKT